MREFDIIVIGGGPAGLSTAARATWLGVPERRLRPRVLLLEASNELGGLSRWQPLVVNAPGVFFTKRELGRTVQACLAHGVSIEQGRVREVRACPGGWSVRTDHGEQQALAVVVTVGMRCMFSDELPLRKLRRLGWIPETDALQHSLRDFERRGWRRLAVLGAAGVDRAGEAIARLGTSLQVECIAESADADAALRVADLRRHQDGVEIALEDAAGALPGRYADAVLIDFDSYEATATTLAMLAPDLPRGAGGFLAPQGASLGLPGLFAAGDAAGPPFSIAKALAEATCAGFAAYSHVVECQLGVRPNLFPYWSSRA